jgi:hypothetical protein
MHRPRPGAARSGAAKAEGSLDYLLDPEVDGLRINASRAPNMVTAIEALPPTAASITNRAAQAALIE